MKNILVIGGSSGIGRATVNQLDEQGYQVLATYRSQKPNDNFNNTSFYMLNVTENVLNLDFVTERLDGIVFCPGSIPLKPFRTAKPDAFLADYNLQVIGFIKVLQALLKKLNKGASIVLFSSVAVDVGFNFHSIIGATKGAIQGLTTSLAAELAPKVRVNAIAPSLVKTPLTSVILNSEVKEKSNNDRHPLKRVGTPEDIANMVSFLVSDDASWITGQIIHIDGGKSSLSN